MICPAVPLNEVETFPNLSLADPDLEWHLCDLRADAPPGCVNEGNYPLVRADWSAHMMRAMPRPGACATTVNDPTMPFAVSGEAVAVPVASVMALSASLWTNRPDAPEAGAVNITLTPDRGLPEESCTMAFRSVVNGVPTTVLCSDPVAARILPGAPEVLVRSNAVPLGIPVAVATTWYVPTRLLAKKAGAVAMPEPAVAAVAILFL
jgi:hypothetical protein